jgi:hypothetical protein
MDKDVRYGIYRIYHNSSVTANPLPMVKDLIITFGRSPEDIRVEKIKIGCSYFSSSASGD